MFNGLINVAQHAIKTDGQMTNNNRCWAAYPKWIPNRSWRFADDVKCSHGATIGRVDDEQLFYLRSRGITQQAAQQMILTPLPPSSRKRSTMRRSGSRYWRVLASVCRG